MMATVPREKDSAREEGGALERLTGWLAQQHMPPEHARHLVHLLRDFHASVERSLRTRALIGVSAETGSEPDQRITLRLLRPDERSDDTEPLQPPLPPVPPHGLPGVVIDFQVVEELPEQERGQYLGLLGLTPGEQAAASRARGDLKGIAGQLRATLGTRRLDSEGRT